VEEIERIRWAHLREGLSLRRLARRFLKRRNALGRALRDPGPRERRPSGGCLRPQ
jgi:hypothetical protein